MPAEPLSDKNLFLAALDLPVAGRTAFLDRECAGDPALRGRLEALLRGHGDPPSAVDRPSFGLAAPDQTATFGTGDPETAGFDGSATGDYVPQPDAGTVIAGKYKLIQPIGEGGMGAVWMAQQTEPVRRGVAVKLIKAGMDSKGVLARFDAERQALAVMDHPNIAKVLDGGLHEGRPFFVMELVKGVPITQYCDEGKLTTRERLELFVPVCQAIQHAHQKGVIHRDIKPSNVLVALYDDKPVPKVIDFGIAKATGPALTDHTLMTGFGAVVGTPEYMSPEQASLNNLDIDTRSDVYSLGVLLYELLVGSPPFRSDELRKAGLLEMLRVVREDEPQRPSAKLSTANAVANVSANRGTERKKLAGVLRNELDWIVMRSLEKDRARRYESAAGFAADVQRYLDGEAVQAHPPSAAYRLRKVAMKHRPLLATTGAFVCLLLFFGVVSSWLAVIASKAEIEAIKGRESAVEERDRADGAANRADNAAREASARSDDYRKQIARMLVATGTQLADRGKFFTALPWLVKPLTQEGLSEEEERTHRSRVGSYLRNSIGRPTLRHIFFCDSQIDFKVGRRNSVKFSPDGKRLLAMTKNGIHVWELGSGELLATLGRATAVDDAQFAPDGSRVHVSHGDATTSTWDVSTGARVLPPFHDFGGLWQRPSALLPHTTWHAVMVAGMKASEDQDAIDGRWINVEDITSNFLGTSLTPDGNHAIHRYARFQRVFDLNALPVKLMAQSSRGQILTTDARYLATDTGESLDVNNTITLNKCKLAIPRKTAIKSFVASPDGTRFLTVGDDDLAHVWDAATGQKLTMFSLAGVRSKQEWKFSPDNRILAGFSAFGQGISFLNSSSGQLIRDFPSKNYLQSEFRPDGGQILRVSSDSSGQVVLLNDSTSWEEELCLPHVGVQESCYSPDGRTVSSASADGTIRVWDLSDRLAASRWQPPEDGEFWQSCRVRNQIRRKACQSIFGGTHNVYTVTQAETFAIGHPDSLLPADTRFGIGVVSPDRSRLVTLQIDAAKRDRHDFNSYRLWDVQSGKTLGPEHLVGGWKSKADYDQCTCLTFSNDSNFYAVSVASRFDREGGSATLYNARNGQQARAPLVHNDEVLFTTFSPDSKLLVTCCRDSKARLWATEAGHRDPLPLAHGDEVTRAVFTPNGKLLVTASLDGLVRVWQVSDGAAVATLDLKNGHALDLDCNPDGTRLLVTFCNDREEYAGTSVRHRIWDLGTFQELSPIIQRGKSAFTGSDRSEFRTRKDGRVTFGCFDRRAWDFSPDTRPIDDLVKLSELYSQMRLDVRGNPVSIARPEMQNLWRELSLKYPDEFIVQPAAAIEWRLQEREEWTDSNQTRQAYYRRWLAADLLKARWQPGEPGNEEMPQEEYVERLLALAAHAMPVEAGAAAEALSVRVIQDADTAYKCGCVLSLASNGIRDRPPLAEQYAASCVSLLRASIAAKPALLKDLVADPDLEIVRGRDDFKLMLSKTKGGK